MKQVEALETVHIGPGTRLALSREQALARGNRLISNGDGVYETTQHMEFKRGEKFGIEGVVPKSMREFVIVDGSAPKPKEQAVPSEPVKFVMPKPEDMPIRGQTKATAKKK